MTKYWKGKKVLITGAGGFIASHLTGKLVAQSANVRAFTRYNSRGDIGLLSFLSPDELSNVEIVSGDLRDAQAVREAVNRIDHIFHLGALVAIPYSYKHPVEVVESNVLGTLNVLLAAREAGVRRIIHTSTSEVYGTAVKVPIDESHPLQGQSPYAASKIGADKLAESFNLSYDLPVVTVRPFNTYGPRQSARAVIPTIISQAISKDIVYLGNLDVRRDLTYVEDTVDGFLRAGSTPNNDGKTFNLGSGIDISIGELVEMIGSLIGKSLNVEIVSDRLRPEKSEVKRLLSSNQFAKDKLGWEPRISLQSGLEQTVAWISDNIEIYKPDEYQI